MLNLIKKLYNDSRIRYLFFGGLTTLVNLGMFALLKGPCGIDYKISNFFSVAIAICFAFVVNKLYVFQSKSESFADTIHEFIKFVLGRLVTMAVEVGGVPFCVEHDLSDKIGSVFQNPRSQFFSLDTDSEIVFQPH